MTVEGQSAETTGVNELKDPLVLKVGNQIELPDWGLQCWLKSMDEGTCAFSLVTKFPLARLFGLGDEFVVTPTYPISASFTVVNGVQQIIEWQKGQGFGVRIDLHPVITPDGARIEDLLEIEIYDPTPKKGCILTLAFHKFVTEGVAYSIKEGDYEDTSA